MLLVTGADLSTYIARPNQSLADHLAGVADGVAELIEDAGQTPYGDDWADLMRTLAWTHDIGKLTEYFQTYITTQDRQSAASTELTYHGFVSALVTANALARQGVAPETTAAGFYAVAKHHSVLNNIPQDFSTYHQAKSVVDRRYELAETQLDSIDSNASGAADTVLQHATDGVYGWNNLMDDGVAVARGILSNIDSVVSDEAFYGYILRVWSILVTADKFDASAADDEKPVTLRRTDRPPLDKVDERVQELADVELPNGETAATYLENPEKELPEDGSLSQRLTAVRTLANAQATETLQTKDKNGEQVFELTLPTGFGKTFTGVRAALTLAETRESRVIYALPYTSILDQVDLDVQDTFGIEPTDECYTKHHHLADTRTRFEARDPIEDDASSGEDTLHAEAWRSGLVLTTFTQLLESAAGPRNIQSTKLPALQDSVIILDEPQALSLEWWNLLGRLTQYLTAEYDATIVFMTATQPRILNELSSAPTPTPLVDCTNDCIDLLRESPRVRFYLHQSVRTHLAGSASPLPLSDAATELRDAATADNDNLAIVNTVGSAVTLAEALQDEDTVSLGAELLDYYDENGGEFDSVAYLDTLAERYPDRNRLQATLTTRLRPVDRRKLLDALKSILDSETVTPFDDVPTTTVSTQLIEAGIDVSFDRLYRDYAPLPALVQAAGRCNREFGGKPATVTLWRLDSPPEDDYLPSSLIYGGKSLLRPTKTALSKLRDDSDQDSLAEAAVVTDGIEWYYDALHQQRQTDARNDRLVDAFDTAQGKRLRDASLITNEYPMRDMLVLTSSSDTDMYDQYRRHRDSKEWKKARAKFQSLQELLVTVPADSGTENDGFTVVRSFDEDQYEVVSGRGVESDDFRSDSEI